MGKTNEHYQEEYARLARIIQEKGIKYKAQADRLGLDRKIYQARRTDSRYTVTEEMVGQLRQEFYQELAGAVDPTPLEQELANLKALAEEQARRLANQEEVIAGLARILEDPDEWVRRLAQVQAEIARLKEEEEEKPRPVSRRGAFYLLTLSLILEDLTGNVPCFALLLLFFFPDG